LGFLLFGGEGMVEEPSLVDVNTKLGFPTPY